MRPLLDLLVPSVCDGCGRPAPPPWCDVCDAELRRSRARPQCPSCAVDDVTGHGCWVGEPPLAGLVTLGAWSGGVATALARAKLVGRREVLREAGARLGDEVARSRPTLAAEVAAVVAVPTDRGRARRRGADHTASLAGGVARGLGVPVARPFGSLRGAPDRVAGPTAHDGVGRPVQVPDVVVPNTVTGRVVVLVDDVVTTGATLWTVAAVLAAHDVVVLAAAVGRAGARPLVGPP